MPHRRRLALAAATGLLVAGLPAAAEAGTPVANCNGYGAADYAGYLNSQSHYTIYVSGYRACGVVTSKVSNRILRVRLDSRHETLSGTTMACAVTISQDPVKKRGKAVRAAFELGHVTDWIVVGDGVNTVKKQVFHRKHDC